MAANVGRHSTSTSSVESCPPVMDGGRDKSRPYKMASVDQFGKDVISGRRNGVGASTLRALLRVAEPIYTGVVATRNAMFNRGRKTVHRLPRPVISIGNITTGGTGKTPVVCHVARHLRELEHQPGILLRGY